MRVRRRFRFEAAHRFDATIGVATEGEGPMALPSVTSQLDLPASDVLPYAPAAGTSPPSRLRR